jgi:tetratricopeptide (TPR) repeat protein
MLQLFKRLGILMELTIGCFLPWKLRCKYSEFLMKLGGRIPINFGSQIIEDKQRNFEKYLLSGAFYVKEGKFKKATEELSRALEIDPNNYRVAYIYHLLSICYNYKGESDRSLEKMNQKFQPRRIVVQNKINMDSVYTPSENVVAREVQGEFIIIPITSGIADLEDEIFTLNETGRVIWNKLDGKKSLQKVVAELASEFEGPVNEVEKDVLGLAKELLKRKILIEAKG